MKGPAPKNPALLRRRNKPTTRAVLPSERETAGNAVPILPPREDGAPWHSKVIDWWTALWRSPMAAEYTTLDRHELYLVAYLHHDAWSATSASARAAALAEIRHQGRRFGHDPMSRRALQWEVAEDGQAPAAPVPRPPTPKRGKDPRRLKLA